MSPNVSNIKNSGLKVTIPRLKILEVFQTHPKLHLSADEVFGILYQAGVDIGLATVYRVLAQFEQAQILVRHHFEGGRAVYELKPGSHHDHLVCMDCGKVEEFFDKAIEERQNQVAKAKGFVLQDHVLSLYASCMNAATCPHKTAQALAPVLLKESSVLIET